MPGSRPLVPTQGVALPHNPYPLPARKEVISDDRVNSARRAHWCRRLPRLALYGAADMAGDSLPRIRFPAGRHHRGPGNPQPHYRPRPMAHQAMNYPSYPRRWCPMPDASPNTDIDLQEVSTRNDQARHIVAGFASAMPWLTDIWEYLQRALNDVPALSAEVDRLSAEVRAHAA